MKSKELAYPLGEKALQTIQEQIIGTLKEIEDPEMGINIYDLGLIYEVSVEPSGIACIKMTLTTPGCPEAPSILHAVKSNVDQVDGVVETQVDLVWDPPWRAKAKLTEATLLDLGLI